METELNILIVTAASIGFLHTLLGPDHYLPFVMVSWARKWSPARTALITFLCGLGHIASSIVLGLIGVSLGLTVKKLELFESTRGSLAAWMLIGFGLAYFIWGLRRAYKNRPHTHSHIHIDNIAHTHNHSHEDQHSHIHSKEAAVNVTPWALFIIFVFGPCEPLIPVLMYPAVKSSLLGMVVVICVFGTVTIATMLGLVLLCRAGVNLVPLTKLQRYSHAIAGITILLCGLAIQFMDL